MWCDVMKLRHSRYTRERKTYEKSTKQKSPTADQKKNLKSIGVMWSKEQLPVGDRPERGERLKGEAAMPIQLFVSLRIRQQLDLLASMTSCCTVFLLLADDPYAFLRSKGIFVKLFSKPSVVCVRCALFSCVVSLLLPVAFLWNDERRRQRWTEGWRKVSTIIFTFLLLATFF